MSRIDIKDIQTPIIAQELWLIEQYIKPTYWLKMVDAWERMIEIAETALDAYMQHIPSDYRRRGLPYQPDATWGQTVIPNFKAGDMRADYLRLLKGDYDLQTSAGGIHSDIRGSSEFWHGWMEEPALHARMGFNVKAEFDKQQDIASMYAANISFTFDGMWESGDLTESKLEDTSRGYDITLPTEWPMYRLNPMFQCASGELKTESGIYIPAIAGACANFLAVSQDFPNARNAYMGFTSPDGSSRYEPTIWTMVERVSDTGGGPVTCRIVSRAEYVSDSQPPMLSAQPGEVCPKAGRWMTQALLSLRTITLKAGERFPSQATDKSGNAVIWYFMGEA